MNQRPACCPRPELPPDAPAPANGLRRVADLPGPPGLPLLGNLLQFDRAKPHLSFERWRAEYGPTFRFKLGTKLLVGVSDHEEVQQLLRDRPKRVRRMQSIESVIGEIAGTGLFSAEGESWARQRRLTAPAFHNSRLDDFFPLLAQVTSRLHRVLQQRAGAGELFEIQRDFMRFTVDATTWLSLNRDVNTLETGGDDFQRDLEQIFPAIERRINAPFPYWRYLQFRRDRELREALIRIRRRIADILAATRKQMDGARNEDRGPANLLEALITASEAGDSPLSEDEIFGNIITILTAGEDTTAYTLAWTTLYLAEHPKVQARVFEEARRVFGDRVTPEKFADLQSLDFVEAVASESMRVKPVAPALFLEAVEELVVDGTIIPPKTILLVFLTSDAQRDENFSRASEFLPERWMAAERPLDWNHNLRSFMPFGSGTRICPGRNLALTEIKLVLAMLCRHFEVVRPASAGPVDEGFAFSRVPVNLRVQLIPRPQ